MCEYYGSGRVYGPPSTKDVEFQLAEVERIRTEERINRLRRIANERGAAKVCEELIDAERRSGEASYEVMVLQREIRIMAADIDHKSLTFLLDNGDYDGFVYVASREIARLCGPLGLDNGKAEVASVAMESDKGTTRDANIARMVSLADEVVGAMRRVRDDMTGCGLSATHYQAIRATVLSLRVMCSRMDDELDGYSYANADGKEAE